VSSHLDQLLSVTQKENPIQAGLLATLIDGGRLIATGELSETLLNMVPDLVSFERRNLDETRIFKRLCPKDIIFVEKATVDQLWSLAKISGAQVALLSDSHLHSDLVDYAIQEKDLRSAILGLRTQWEKIEAIEKLGFSFDGEANQKALFLDRDGVIIEDTNYVKDADQVALVPGIGQFLKQARAKGYRLVVVTNQSGIGRGIISWEQYDQVTLKMQTLLASEGVILDKIVVSPFHGESQLAMGLGRRGLRKPRPGLIHLSATELRVNVAQSALVGDKARDLISGALAGVGKLFLVKSKTVEAESLAWKQWPLLSRVPASHSMEVVSDWEQILKTL
jgi:histidinol-phosphate phosphatase family protein